MAIDIGRMAYEAYVKNMYGGSCYEAKVVEWKDLGKRGQDAWRHAAVAVSQYLDQAKQDMEDEVIG
jgi:hypothetical protein